MNGFFVVVVVVLVSCLFGNYHNFWALLQYDFAVKTHNICKDVCLVLVLETVCCFQLYLYFCCRFCILTVNNERTEWIFLYWDLLQNLLKGIFYEFIDTTNNSYDRSTKYKPYTNAFTLFTNGLPVTSLLKLKLSFLH